MELTDDQRKAIRHYGETIKQGIENHTTAQSERERKAVNRLVGSILGKRANLPESQIEELLPW